MATTHFILRRTGGHTPGESVALCTTDELKTRFSAHTLEQLALGMTVRLGPAELTDLVAFFDAAQRDPLYRADQVMKTLLARAQ